MSILSLSVLPQIDTFESLIFGKNLKILMSCIALNSDIYSAIKQSNHQFEKVFINMQCHNKRFKTGGGSSTGATDAFAPVH